MKTANKKRPQTAQYRPAIKRRRYAHDDLIAVDLFSGFGGLTKGIQRAGFDTVACANHSPYKVRVHEANHPEAEHWIADLVDEEASNYHSARDLPPADLLAAGVSCVNHSPANTKKAYAEGLTLFDMEDPDYDAAVTRSEKDRATANCVLHYAQQHHPRVILVECTTELQSWGPLVPGKKKVGDGTTYQWWLRQFTLLGYSYRVLFLNSMFFGVPQSRDRLYIAFWDKKIPTPDLDFRPHSWCARCDTVVEAVWTWKTGPTATGRVAYGVQYNYRCPSCRSEVIPPMTPSLAALDLTHLGTRIGDRKKPLAEATMARAERCRQKFSQFPAVLMPAKSQRGVEKHLGQPMATQTSQQETGLLSTGQVMVAHRHNGDGKHITEPMDTVTSTHEKAVLLAVNNYQGIPRGLDESLPTQGGSETLSLVSTGVVPFRKNTVPTTHHEPMPTVTSEQIPGLLTAAGLVKNNGSIDEAGYRSYPVSEPLGSITASPAQSVLFSGFFKQNGTTESQFPVPHPLTDSLGTLTSRDTTALLTAQWHEMLANLTLQECYFRMLGAHEIGRGCGFDVDFLSYKGTFKVWGSARDQTDGYGNAVSPPVGEWLGTRLRLALHRDLAA